MPALLAPPALAAPADLDLLRAYADGGDPAAFAALAARLAGGARRAAADVFPPAADDAAQAALVLLGRRAATVAARGAVAGWVFEAARRLARKARTASARRAEYEALARPPAPPADPLDTLTLREVRAAVADAVDRLPPDLRAALVLCYWDGERQAAAAARAGCPLRTFKRRLDAGRTRVAARLAGRGFAGPAVLAALAAVEAGGRAAAPRAVLAAATGTGPLTAGAAGLLRAAGWTAVGARAAAVVLVGTVVAGAGLAVGFTPVAPPDPPAASRPAARMQADGPPADAAGDPLPAGAVARLGTVRFRPGAAVRALAFAPDGKRVASWGWGPYKWDRFSVWDAATGAELQTARTVEDSLLAFGWAADGRGAAVLKGDVVYDGTRSLTTDLRVWAFPAAPPAPLPDPFGRPRGLFPPPPGAKVTAFDAAATSADGKRLAVATWAAGRPGPVTVYKLAATDALTRAKPVAAFDPPPGACSALAFSPDGRHLVGSGTNEDKEKSAVLVVWDAATGKVAHTAAVPTLADQFSDQSLATSNALAAVGLASGDTFVVDLRTGAGRTVPTGHRAVDGNGAGVYALAFSPDGGRLATAGPDRMVRVWEAATGRAVRAIGPLASWPNAVAFAPDGGRLATGGQDGVIRVWDPATGAERTPTGGHPGAVRKVAADGATVVTAAEDHALRVWDARTGAERRRVAAGGPVAAGRLTPDGRRIAAVVGEWDAPVGQVKVWDAATGADATPPGFPAAVPAQGAEFTPDGGTLVTFADDKLTAWDWPGGRKRWAAEMPKPVNTPGINRVDSVAVSADGRWLVTVAGRYWSRAENGFKFASAADGVVDLWDAKTGERVRRLAESDGTFRPAAFAADGSLIHTGGGTFPHHLADGKAVTTSAAVCVLDPATGRLVREFTPSGRPAPGPNSGHGLALSADGKALFRSVDGGGVEAYEVATGRFRAALDGHRDTVNVMAAPAADPRRLVTGSLDTTALVWDVGFGAVTPAPSTPGRRAELWAALGDADGEDGYRAMRALAADPGGFVALAAAELTPAPVAPPVADLVGVFRDLGSPTFAVREAAAKRLDGYGEAAVPAARAHLAGGPAAEVRARLDVFLARVDAPPSGGPGLRRVRTVELLEHLGTPDAKALLTRLAAGGPSRLTVDAAGSLARLNRR